MSKQRTAVREKLNPAAITIINPGKEYWASRGSNQRLIVLPSEPKGLALQMVVNILWNFYPLVFLQQDLVIPLEPVGVCWKLCMRPIGYTDTKRRKTIHASRFILVTNNIWSSYEIKDTYLLLSDGHFELQSISLPNLDHNFQIKDAIIPLLCFSGIRVVIDLDEAIFVVCASV